MAGEAGHVLPPPSQCNTHWVGGMERNSNCPRCCRTPQVHSLPLQILKQKAYIAGVSTPQRKFKNSKKILDLALFSSILCSLPVLEDFKEKHYVGNED